MISQRAHENDEIKIDGVRETAQLVRSKATIKPLFLKPIQISSIILFDFTSNNN